MVWYVYLYDQHTESPQSMLNLFSDSRESLFKQPNALKHFTMEVLDETEETSVERLPNCSDDDDDDDDSSYDEDENLKSIHRINTANLRRNASMESFITRSERSMIIGLDRPPSVEELRTRKVQFAVDPVIHQIPKEEDQDVLDRLFLTDSDFDRMDADMKLTHFRWQNHVSGVIPFDEQHNTVRGLEFFDRELQMAKDLEKYRHRQQVLGEYLEQKKKKSIDWESIRRVSLLRSSFAIEKAIEMAANDTIARHKAWEPPVPNGISKDKNGKSKKEKKKRNGFMFWKKR